VHFVWSTTTGVLEAAGAPATEPFTRTSTFCSLPSFTSTAASFSAMPSHAGSALGAMSAAAGGAPLNFTTPRMVLFPAGAGGVCG
jgi:hypothetical protein